jgi:hypothetical protein
MVFMDGFVVTLRREEGEVRSYLLRVIGKRGEEVASFQCSVFREEGWIDD